LEPQTDSLEVPAEAEQPVSQELQPIGETVEPSESELADNAVPAHAAYEEFLKDNGEDLDSLSRESEETLDDDEEQSVSKELVAKIDASGEIQIEVDTNNARVWNELGNVYYNSGAFDDAIVAYSKAIELDRQFAWPYSNLALTYVQKERFVEAILLYQRSIELFSSNKDRAISWNRLGNVYRRLNDYDNAISAYQQADQLDPDNTTLSQRSRFSLLGNYYLDSKSSYVA
jgi:tetratricopeptide (TPR) repeat protein